jgi:hypothetical protein
VPCRACVRACVREPDELTALLARVPVRFQPYRQRADNLFEVLFLSVALLIYLAATLDAAHYSGVETARLVLRCVRAGVRVCVRALCVRAGGFDFGWLCSYADFLVKMAAILFILRHPLLRMAAALKPETRRHMAHRPLSDGGDRL